jgi:hypothetical protein
MADFLHIVQAFSKSLAVALLCCAVLFVANCHKSDQTVSVVPPPTATPPDPYREAINKLEELRSGPVGRKAQVTVPSELQHYADRRRFLAIQEAAWRERNFERPQGYLELLSLIEKGGLVEMEPLGKDYILYGAGEMADTEPFTFFDVLSKKPVNLFADQDDWLKGKTELDHSIANLQEQNLALQNLYGTTQDRAARADMSKQIAENDHTLTELSEKRDLLEFFYNDPVRKEMLFARSRWLGASAANFKGRGYDLTNPTERREFKMKMLSFIRPEARAVILQLAAAYKEKYARQLPITSLIRTQEYQQRLREVNPNATGKEIPPHTTGLAFDIYDGWMDAEEQTYLMNLIASLEAGGRVEALRENRNHIHVFAFADGHPPTVAHIAQALGK